MKKRVWLANGYGSFRSVWRTLQGIEAMHMINKGRVGRLAKGDSVGQAHFVASLLGSLPENDGGLPWCLSFAPI